MKKQEHTHYMGISKSPRGDGWGNEYLVDFYCNFTDGGSAPLGQFPSIYRAFEYAEGHAKKRKLGIRFDDGTKQTIFSYGELNRANK